MKCQVGGAHFRHKGASQGGKPMKINYIHEVDYHNWVLGASHPTQGRRYTNATALLSEIAAQHGIEVETLPGRVATREELELVHTGEYIDQVVDQHVSGAWDGANPELASLAARLYGGTMAAVELALAGELNTVHLPGAKHHAMASYASGFCVFADFAGAAAALTQQGKRVAILDIDVHHGDGTEALCRVLRGAEAGLKSINMDFLEKTSYKRGATDFSSQVARMKSAGCEMVVLGTIIRETVGTIAESRKTGFNPVFLGSSAAYTDLIHKLGGKAMDGMYATMTVPHPYLDEASNPIRFWANKYKTKFNEDPTVFSVYGYVILDTFIQAAQKTGPNLTSDSFIATMDKLTVPTDIFGSPEGKFTPTQHLGSNKSRLSQIQDGKWKIVSDYYKLD